MIDLLFSPGSAEMVKLITTILIFVVAYTLIISEKIHRTKVALLGAMVLIVIGAFGSEITPIDKFIDAIRSVLGAESGGHGHGAAGYFATAVSKIDFNTIGLLCGMMIIVVILKETGIFQFLAIYAAKKAKGNVWYIMLFFAVLTAIASAFLDNVTTVLLLAPVTIFIADALKKSPFPFLVVEIITSNVGGTATLIGDPPNILIGGATGISFMDFVIHLGPIVVITMVVVMFIVRWVFRKEFEPTSATVDLDIDPKTMIKDKVLMIKSLVVLGITLFLFVIHDSLHLMPATVAMFGAGLLLIISKTDIHKVLEKVEWPVLFFFMGLFVIVGALESVGVLKWLAELTILAAQSIAQDRMMQELILCIFVLFIAAIASAFVDNIPFVMTMIPLIEEISIHLFPDLTGVKLVEASLPLWWSLALGGCFGGNGTIIGASANIVVAGFSEKTKKPITFGNYFKYGFPIMLVTIVLATIYIVLRYYVIPGEI